MDVKILFSEKAMLVPVSYLLSNHRTWPEWESFILFCFPLRLSNL